MTSYMGLVEYVRLLGQPVTVRGLVTREILGAQVQHPAGVLVNRDGLNHALGYMELCQLIAGMFNVDAIARVAPKAEVGLFTMQAAYGPRVKLQGRDQLFHVLEELRADSGSRRAVIYMSEPLEQVFMRPCTSSLQFLVRDNIVHCVVSMRSWDLYLGAPYDLTMFGGLVLLVAQLLGYQPGTVHVTAGSAHIYLDKHPVGGWAHRPKLQFRFSPRLDSLELFRCWALDTVNDPSWLHGAPAGITQSEL